VDEIKLGVDKRMLLWADGFDQYGGFNLTLSGYTDANVNSLYNNAGNARTGNGAIGFGGVFNGQVLRRALAAPVNVLGQGVGIKVNTSPIVNRESLTNGLNFESAGKVRELIVVPNPSNGISVVDRTGVVRGVSANNLFSLSSYFYYEVKATKNVAGANTGTVEVRFQGNTVLIVNGIDLPNQFSFACLGAGVGFNQTGQFDFDDWVVWDNSGAQNNTFLGDRRLVTCYPNANLALQDFTPVPAGNAWDRVNDSPPSGSAYIEGTAAGNISEFSKTAIGIAANDIAAVVGLAFLNKSDAGVATARIGINSAGFVDNSPELFPGTGFTYFQNIWELNPNGNIPWTRVAADAAAIRITRVS
jgi:hypothetical protein